MLQDAATPKIPPVNQIKSKGEIILYSLGVSGKLEMNVRKARNANKVKTT
jgi:hypothetical protein